MAKADEFDKLFGDLAIGTNPTPKRNQYLVMKWDFSLINAQGNIHEIHQALHDFINGCIEQFKILEPVKAKLAEAKKQLLDYRTSLELKYDNAFKLHSITVVAVGFDRLVWQKVE